MVQNADGAVVHGVGEGELWMWHVVARRDEATAQGRWRNSLLNSRIPKSVGPYLPAKLPAKQKRAQYPRWIVYLWIIVPPA